MNHKDLIHNQKYLLNEIRLGKTRKIIAYFNHIEDSGYGVNKAYFDDVDGHTWIVPFLSIVPVTPISSLEAELW